MKFEETRDLIIGVLESVLDDLDSEFEAAKEINKPEYLPGLEVAHLKFSDRLQEFRDTTDALDNLRDLIKKASS